MNSNNHSKKIVLLIIIVSAIIWWIMRLHSYVGVYADDACYITLAKTLLAGKGYVDIIFPGNPPHRQFPPGFPIFLTPFVLIVGEQLELLRLVNIIVTSIALFLCFILFRKYLAKPYIWMFLVVIATNHLFVTYSSSVMSEPIFLVLTIGFFILTRVYEYNNNWIAGLILGILIMVSTSVRAIGIFLLLPLFYLGVCFKDVKLLVLGTVPTIVLLVLAQYFGWLNFYSTYHHGAPFFLDFSILWMNVQYYAKIIIQEITWLGIASGGTKFFQYTAIIILIGAGFFKDWDKENVSFKIYCFTCFCIIIFYRIQDARLLLPILPFLYYFLLKGFTHFFKARKIIAIVTSFLWLYFIVNGLMGFYFNFVVTSHSYNTPDSLGFKWLNTHTNQNDIILSTISYRGYMFTGRKYITFSKWDEPYKILLYIYQNNVKYLYFTTDIFSPEATGKDLFGLNDYWKIANEDSIHFRLVFKNHDHIRSSYIYEVLPKKDSFLKAIEAANKGAYLYQRGNYKEAVKVLRESILLERDYYVSLNLLGIVLVDMGNIEEGIEILTKSVTLYPDIDRSYASLAYAYLKAGRRFEAIGSLRKALALATAQNHSQRIQEIQQELDRLQNPKMLP